MRELAFGPGSWKRSPFPPSPGPLTSVVPRSLLGTLSVTHVGVRAREERDANVVWRSCFLVPSGGELEVVGAWERVCVPDVCASSWSRPVPLCAGVGRRPGREGAARAAPLHERSRSPPCSPIANQDEAFENTALVAEVEGSLAGGTTAAGRSSHQLVLIGHISPSSGSAFVGHCLRARARTGSAGGCRYARGPFAELSRHLQGQRAGRQARTSLPHPIPSPVSAQHLGRSVLPRKSAHG